MSKLDFILTSDDVGRDTTENFNKFISLLDEYNIKCTFFAVPKPRDNIPLAENKEWIYVLKKAVNDGHDVQLHGYTHEQLECGIPPNFMLDIVPSLKKKVAEERNEIEKNLELSKLVDRLSKSKEIFEKVMGYSPICFRSPLLATHENLYKALVKLGIKYNTNFVVNPTGWYYIVENGKPIEERNYPENNWNKEGIMPVPTKAQESVTELPLSSEYSWFLKEKDLLDREFYLMKDDAHKISEIKNSFMLPLSHFFAIIKEPVGIELYKKFFSYAKDNFDFKSYTIKDYIKEKNLDSLFK